MNMNLMQMCFHCVFTHTHTRPLTHTYTGAPLNPGFCFIQSSTNNANNDSWKRKRAQSRCFHLVLSKEALQCNITGPKQVLRCCGFFKQPLRNKPEHCLSQNLTCLTTPPFEGLVILLLLWPSCSSAPHCGL